MDNYSKKDLIQMMAEFNKQFGTKMKTKGTKKDLITEFKKSLSCKLDKCVVKRSKKVQDVLKPLGPNENEWLSNFDILRVMEEYEKLYDNFKFLGCVPIDFNEIDKSFSNFNLKKFKKNFDIIGAIFNTDPSWKSGQHWVALSMNIPKKTICFFDSEGSVPLPQIQAFIDKLKYQGLREKINFEVFSNNKKHQRGNSACGIYCLHFIIKQLQGHTCKAINENVIKDKDMKKNLKIYFNT
jgi:hypothetical protein